MADDRETALRQLEGRQAIRRDSLTKGKAQIDNERRLHITPEEAEKVRRYGVEAANKILQSH